MGFFTQMGEHNNVLPEQSTEWLAHYMCAFFFHQVCNKVQQHTSILFNQFLRMLESLPQCNSNALKSLVPTAKLPAPKFPSGQTSPMSHSDVFK